MNESDNQGYLEFAKALALDAGVIMKRYFLQSAVDWKSDHTPVTVADTTINQLVIERINQAYPDHSILGEEASDIKDSRLTWVCDPVDGTMPYSHGLPISAFSLALCLDGQPIVGVVYDPFMDRLFSAHKGGGAFCNGQPLKVNSTGLKNSLIDIEAEDKIFINLDRPLRDMVQATGAHTTKHWAYILPTCLVASGQYAATLFCIDKPEDGAAIRVIVEEAGGKVTDLYGNDQRYDRPTKGVIASNGVVHDELVQLIRESAMRDSSAVSSK